MDRRVASDLISAGVKVFVPTETVVRVEQSNGRTYRRREERLLFRGYLFFCAADEEDRYQASKSIHKISVIPIVNQKRVVHELQQFEIAMSRGVTGVMVAYRPGDRVRIVKGPMAGVCGKYRSEHKGYVFLGLTDLGDMQVECPAEFVEPADEIWN